MATVYEYNIECTMKCNEYDYDIPDTLELDYNYEWLDDVSEKWNDSKNFAGLLKNMKLFIQGEIPDTPEHAGALQDKDPEYINRLLQLNAIGILTTNGQEFKQTITKDKIYMQREYINFTIKPISKESLESIITKFNDADLFYYAISYDDKKVYQTPSLGRIGFDNPEFWVTRTLQRRTNTYENHTHIVEPCDLLSNDMNFSYYAKDLSWNGIFPSLEKYVGR